MSTPQKREHYGAQTDLFLLHFTLLSFADASFCVCVCVFYKLQVGCNPTLSKSSRTIFPMAFAHITSLPPLLVILTIFQT